MGSFFSFNKAEGDSKRDRDAERQLSNARSSMFRGGKSGGGRARTRPDNAGLSDREIRALDAENHGATFFRRGVVSERARKGGNR